MILFASSRTDISHYLEWFFKRIEIGFVDVRNPYFNKKVSRIFFKDVDGILFCTKNPISFIPYLDKLQIPFIFHVTITPYKKDIEPFIHNKNDIIDAVKKISSIIGKNKVYIRYDPIFINDYYTLEYHTKAFEKLCSLLEGYTEHIIVSFLDDYKNVQKNISVINYHKLTDFDYSVIGKSFALSAKAHQMTVQTCFEENTLIEYGFIKQDCMSRELVQEFTGKDIKKKWTARKGKKCSCIEMVDIGSYNTCTNFCKYCYANYDEQKVKANIRDHDPSSSLLIGKLNSDYIITIRK